MRSVEQAQLDQLVLADLVGEGDAVGVLPGGPAGRELVLHDPHRESLGGDGDGVVEARDPADRLAHGVRRGGDDAVDHRVGEGHIGLQPGEKLRPRACLFEEFDDEGTGDVAR